MFLLNRRQKWSFTTYENLLPRGSFSFIVLSPLEWSTRVRLYTPFSLRLRNKKDFFSFGLLFYFYCFFLLEWTKAREKGRLPLVFDFSPSLIVLSFVIFFTILLMSSLFFYSTTLLIHFCFFPYLFSTLVSSSFSNLHTLTKRFCFCFFLEKFPFSEHYLTFSDLLSLFGF